MGKFLKGLFIGIGIGLFVAPQTGEETRRLIMQRIAALRKSMSPDDEQHFVIDAHPSQTVTLPLQPDQPAVMPSGEPLQQVTIRVRPGQPVVMPPSKPLEGITISAPPEQPVTASFTTEPLEQVTTSVLPDQPVTTSSSQSQEQDTTDLPAAGTQPTLSDQNVNATEGNRNSAEAAPPSDLTMHPPIVSDVKPDQQTSAETPETDTERKLNQPTLSSVPGTSGRTARRKASTRTPSTGKTRGHNKS